MESGTNVHLTQISGIVDPKTGRKDIWARGGTDLIRYDGEKWETVWTIENPIFPADNSPASFFFPDPEHILITAGHFPFNEINGYLTRLDDFTLNKIVFNTEVSSFGIAGIAVNDLILMGDFGKVGHYNGSTVRNYPDINNNGINRKVVKHNDKVYIVGGLYGQLGFMLRGLRN